MSSARARDLMGPCKFTDSPRLAPLALAFSSLACADFTTDDATYSAELVSGGVEVMRIDEKNDTCVHVVFSTIGDPANIPEHLRLALD